MAAKIDGELAANYRQKSTANFARRTFQNEAGPAGGPVVAEKVQ